MKVEFQSPKTVVTASKPSPGSFALEGASELQWVKCREQFASYFTEKTIGFYFSHEFEYSDNVAQFIARTEEIIGCQSSKYAKTNRKWLVWIEPGDFWRACVMRRSLLTILLRCGLRYEAGKDNYEESLYSQEYIKETKDATMRFLFGFTKYIPINVTCKAWVTTFKNVERDMIRRQLVLPDGTELQENTIGINALWA
jgi:hypothetical protein